MDVKFDTNVDMGNKAFTGIKEFAGTMDGNGKKIKNLNIHSTTGAGLIIKMTSGKIKNLTIESGTITDNGNSSGGIEGIAGAFIVSVPEYAYITLEGLTNKATVNGNIASGIIGIAFDANITINNAGNSGAVTGNGTGGGIIGQTKGTTTINNSENSGTIKGNYSPDPSGGIGGIIGNVGDGSSIKIDKIYNYNIKPIIGQSYGNATINITDNSFYLEGRKTTVDARSITATQFRTQSIFTAKGWDFNGTWKMGAKHPKLR